MTMQIDETLTLGLESSMHALRVWSRPGAGGVHRPSEDQSLLKHYPDNGARRNRLGSGPDGRLEIPANEKHSPSSGTLHFLQQKQLGELIR